ncbi:hypothetical protein DENSPDRAFT_532268 [Dentipellis sp. KUC8613]|nr:hypothetical protein DENSPDRAFT_532268 [Dentipellis sp. KUC8613]
MIALLHNTPSATCSPPAPSPCHTPAIDPTPRPGPMFKILLGQDQLDLAYIPISRRLVAPSCVSPVKSASTSASPSTRRKAQQYPNKGSNPRTTISISSANPKKSRHLRQLTPLGAKVAGAKRKAVDSQPFPTDPRKKEDAYERFKKQRTMSDVNGKETARKAVVGVQTAYKKGVVLSSTAREPEMDLYKQFTNDLGYDPSTLLSWTSS